jgi:predicted type IV restriction endonuclease
VTPKREVAMQVSKRFLERAKANLRRYQKLLESARARDVGESDTCVVISDFLADVLGYDKYSEVTTEFAVKSTFCDLAVRVGGRTRFLIEVKSAGTGLKDTHLRQSVDYAANEGVDWVLLTNGTVWQAHRVRFEQPIQAEEVFTIDLLDPEAKPGQLLERLYLISREGISSTAIDVFWQRKEAMNRYVVAQLLLDSSVLGLVRRTLRRNFPGLTVTEADVAELLRSEVLKRDVLEGDKAAAAQRLVRRASRKRERAKAATLTDAEVSDDVATDTPTADGQAATRPATDCAPAHAEQPL